MNDVDEIIKKDLSFYQQKFGVFERDIIYETINGESNKFSLFMFINDNNNPKKRGDIYVHSYGLCCMIFGKEETHRFYFLEKNPYASFVRLDSCVNGSLFSSSFLEKIRNGHALYDHFLELAMDGLMKMKTGVMYVTNTYMDDFFVNPNPDIEYLKKIISNKDPSCYGLWQRLIIQRYQIRMPNVVTRSIEHSIHDGKIPLIALRIIFATMVAEEPAVRRIIERQLTNKGEVEELEFFKFHFVPFIKICIDVLINYPYAHDEIQWVFAGTIARIQLAWQSKSKHICKITVDKRKQTMDALATNAQIKRVAKKSKPHTKRGKRNNQKKLRIGRKGRQ